MAKEPTSPPEGTTKPNPPPNVPSKQGVPPPLRSPTTGRRLDGLPESAIGCGDPLTPEGRDKLFAAKGPSVTLPTEAFRGAPPDPLVVTAKAACDEHPDCTMVTTGLDPRTPLARAMLEGGRTSDPGYEPPSRTNEESPDCVPIGQTIVPTFEPPGERPGEAGGPFWDVPPAEVPPDFEGTVYEPYAIIKDMRALYTDFVNDVMDATYKLRSGALKWLCRAIALTFGSVVLSFLVIGAVGVFGAVWLFKALDWAERKYWLSTAGDPDTLDDFAPRERPWK